jgi:Conserved hypothetical ATP binding protein
MHAHAHATRAPQVVQLIERERQPPLRYVFADTPGQIEIFSWSASGQLVTELLASSRPTVVLFVADAPRCAAPQVFMSHMLQAVSILYKMRLPMVLVRWERGYMLALHTAHHCTPTIHNHSTQHSIHNAAYTTQHTTPSGAGIQQGRRGPP